MLSLLFIIIIIIITMYQHEDSSLSTAASTPSLQPAPPPQPVLHLPSIWPLLQVSCAIINLVKKINEEEEEKEGKR